MEGIFAAINLVVEVMGHLLIGFVGASAGVVYPPKTAAWARLRMTGIGLLLATIAAFALAYAAAQKANASDVFWVLIAAGCVFFLCYVVVGNVCRKYHKKTGLASGRTAVGSTRL